MPVQEATCSLRCLHCGSSRHELPHRRQARHGSQVTMLGLVQPFLPVGRTGVLSVLDAGSLGELDLQPASDDPLP
jgi:hypothetical protein